VGEADLEGYGGFALATKGVAQHGTPEYLRSNNGLEFIAKMCSAG